MEDYEFLFDAARSLNRFVKPQPTVAAPAAPSSSEGLRPGDDFCQNGPAWSEILEAHGWKQAWGAGDKVYWKRPGKDGRGWSATTGHCRTDARGDLLYVFSSNAHPFESERTYSKFEAWTVLNHGGDFRAAAQALADAGWGDQPVRLKMVHTRPEKPSADNSADPLDADATAADLIESNSTIRWVWTNWIPQGVLSILASEPGVGKTRFCADLLRRVYNGLPWPDGSPQTAPKGSKALWVPADNQHPELGTLPGFFGFPPEALYLNATRRNPFGGTMLDAPEDLKDFEKRIARVRPVFVFIDTSLNATDRSAHKPEDAKAFFVPLQQIAARQDIAIVCVTHLNASGKPLGRRITGQGRVVIQLEHPDPEGQPDRRKLHVVKSNSLFPPALGVTMHDRGNDYDTEPPVGAENQAGKLKIGKDSAQERCSVWLECELVNGAVKVHELRNAAEMAGFSTKTLYAAKAELNLHEFEMQGRKWWQLPTTETPFG